MRQVVCIIVKITPKRSQVIFLNLVTQAENGIQLLPFSVEFLIRPGSRQNNFQVDVKGCLSRNIGNSIAIRRNTGSQSPYRGCL